jgi:two-component system, LytTR family, sensor kinase
MIIRRDRLPRIATALAGTTLVWGLIGVMFAAHNALTYLADGRRVPAMTILWWSVAEWAPWVVLTPLVLRIVAATRQRRLALMPSVLILASGGVAIAVAQVGFEYGLDRLAVLASDDPGMTVRVWLSGGVRGPVLDLAYLVPRKIGFSYITYWAVVLAALGLEYHRLYVQRDVEAARLEGALAVAQLETLQSQLQPHFLFNTLNAVASLIPDEPEAAEEMVESLSGLLRAALHDARRSEITLERELELLDQYLSIQATRFRGRLSVQRHIDVPVNGALVPPMLMQPLLENAIRYGIAPRSAGGQLCLRVRSDATRLEVTVEDDGPGFSAPNPASTGIGLANIRDRLARLYGNAASLDVGNRPNGGGFARVTFPLHTAGNPADGAPENSHRQTAVVS